MINNIVTPTEYLLQIAPAVRHASSTWFSTPSWARFRELAKNIEMLGQSPISTYMRLEINYVAAVHAIWFTGRAPVVISPECSRDIVYVFLERIQVKVVLYGNFKPGRMPVQVACTTGLIGQKLPTVYPPPTSCEAIQKAPVICSITLNTGSIGVPNGIVYPIRSKNIKADGTFIDKDELERATNNPFAGSVVSYHQSGQRIVLFWTGESIEIKVSKSARKALKNKPGDDVAIAISSIRYLEKMPYNAPHNIDIAQLQKIANSDDAAPVEAMALLPLAPIESSVSRVEGIAQEVARLSRASSVPLILARLNPITVIQFYSWLREKFDYDQNMNRLFEEDVTGAAVQELEVLTNFSLNRRIEIAMDIVHEVARLAKTTSPVPTDVPLMFTGLNSTTIVQLHLWLKSSFDYDEGMSQLFEEDCTAESLAALIVENATATAEAIAKEAGKLAKATKAVLTDAPLILVGLDSIAVSRLQFWSQSEYDHEEDTGRLFEEDVTAEASTRDIRGFPANAEVTPAPAPPSTVVPSVEPEPVKETPTPAKTRAVHHLTPLSLKSSNFTTATPIPHAMKAGGSKAISLPTGTIDDFLALSVLSPPSPNSVTFHGNGTPALNITHASSDMLANLRTPFAPVSAWIPEPLTPKALCV